MAVGSRISEALKLRRMSIRAFHGALQARDPVPEGASYASVHKYLKDHGEPPAEFVEAAADVLRVREEWLLSGEGEPTELDAIAKHVQERPQIDPRHHAGAIADRVEFRMKEAFPPYDELPLYMQPVIWHTIMMVASVLSRPEDDAEGEKGVVERAGEIVAQCLAYPSNLLPEVEINQEQLGHYAMAVCQSLLFAVTPSVKWKPAPAPGTSQAEASSPPAEG